MTEKLVLGRYRVLEKVGRGAMGVIYRGLDPVLDREVAIKVMSADFAAEGADAQKRFFREARAAAKLQHRNIVTVFEFAEEDGVPYIVMEFLRGSSLSARIGLDPPLPLERKLEIIADLCDGLQYASENGIIHRDVKPANVWLLEDGSVKLVDFGIAKILTATSTLGRDVIGSAAYMSPEQAEGKTVDARTDIFSAAVILYELVAGRRPFEASTPTATLLKIVQEQPPPIADIVPDVPPRLIAVIEKALQKDPADRYQSASALGSELRFIRAGMIAGLDSGMVSVDGLTSTTTTRTVGPSSRGSRTTSRGRGGRWGGVLAAGLVGGLVVSGVLAWIQFSKPNPPASPPPAGQTVPPGPTTTTAPTGSGRQGGSAGPVSAATGTGADKPSGPGSGQPRQPLRLRASADYEFSIWDEKNMLSSAKNLHPDVQVPAGTKRVVLKAAEYLLNDPADIDLATMTIPVPKKVMVTFYGNRSDCRLMHPSVQTYFGVVEVPVASGPRKFDFVCNDGAILHPPAVTVGPGRDNRVLVK